ncbi:hypothetical protein J2T55_002378 [Methylohalomonas lacus]|uniref:Uncharacterized protein n=1 Tax=Methylohalomonas lacus TaxID=398773 RepID=A0AAE3HN66_9GAMM|nr:hypothetical protein [Methylohalomonas lacus]
MNETKELRFKTGDMALIKCLAILIDYSYQILSKGARHDHFIDMHRPFVSEYINDDNLMPSNEEQI